MRKGPSQNDQFVKEIKELQEAVKQQAEIIDTQAKQHKEEIEKIEKIQGLPWYKQLNGAMNTTTRSITTHVSCVQAKRKNLVVTIIVSLQLPKVLVYCFQDSWTLKV